MSRRYGSIGVLIEPRDTIDVTAFGEVSKRYMLSGGGSLRVMLVKGVEGSPVAEALVLGRKGSPYGILSEPGTTIPVYLDDPHWEWFDPLDSSDTIDP